MDQEQRAVYIQSQIACFYAELESMKAANKERESRGEALAYSEKDFINLIDKHNLGHNSVVSYLMQY